MVVKFAHMSDVHLGSWRYPELQDLNFKSFQKAMKICIEESVDFILIAGDLFDTAYPPIEILKETFSEFKKLNDAKIPCYLIAGSHDYSVSGKTFLDVLEKAGFCKNVTNFEISEEEIVLKPTIFKDSVAIYGYPGKKTGLEIPEIRKIKLQDVQGLYKILMLHTTLDKAVEVMGNLPIDSVEADSLPQVDYGAMGHLHIDFKYKNFLYPTPIFPNNFAELEKLKHGNFYIIESQGNLSPNSLKKIDLKIKNVEKINFEITNALTATEEAISQINLKDLEDKLVLLRFKGILENSKISNIDFARIEEQVMKKGAYFVLKNTHELKVKDEEVEFETDGENIEEETMKAYNSSKPTEFDHLVGQLLNTLSVEKEEGETSDTYSNRILEESKKIFNF